MPANPARTLGRYLAAAGRAATTVLLVVVTLVAAVYLLPALLGYERYVITGGSMSGTFEKGAIAFERTVPVAELRVGDVITYLPPKDSGLASLVTHRVVAIEEGDAGARVLQTKGDANADVDPWKFVLVDEVQPRVEFTVPLLGYVFIALADPGTRVLLIGVPAGALALASLVEVVQILRRRAEEAPADAPAASREPRIV